MTIELKKALLTAPETQLDPQLFPYIEKWDEPNPSTSQILEVLDYCINGSLASGAIVTMLQVLYTIALKNEGTTHDEVVKGATWRAI